MEIRQLQILRELGERGSVTAVAEALYVTPSAISQQLRLLQRSVAVPLTERQGRRLALTDAGRALAASAGEVETALAKARDAVDAFINEPGGPVHLAAFHSAAEAFFPPLVRAFGKPGPPRLCLADEDVAQTEFATLTGDYDIVLAHRLDHTPPWPPGVSVTALLHDFDYEIYPEIPDHAVKGEAILIEKGVEAQIRRAILSHASYSGVMRESPLEKTLFACDELAGFITAISYVKPHRSVFEVDVASVKKKMKDKAFARSVNRQEIVDGAQELGVPLEEHIDFCVRAMQANAEALGIKGGV